MVCGKNKFRVHLSGHGVDCLFVQSFPNDLNTIFPKYPTDKECKWKNGVQIIWSKFFKFKT